MGSFQTKLEVEQVTDVGEEGRGRWELMTPLVYKADSGVVYTVPTGFVTDFASVPRVPIAFWLFGDRGNEAATLHDWLYSGAHAGLTREQCDGILKEALVAQGVPSWIAWCFYWGVRMGGGSHWGVKT
jgi:hypothetical protein